MKGANAVTKRIALATLMLAVTLPLHAGFSEVARALDSQRGVKRIWVPFLGLARVAVWLVEPAGVGDFQLATFEGTDGVDPRELESMMRQKVGKGFTPLVQARSKRGEWSFIYARPSKNGERVELMILAKDNEETVLVRVEVDAAEVARHIELEPRHISRVASR
jgi:hypothetical protein